MRRSTRLIISSISTVGNYEYGFFWKLMLDGQIECEVQATGIISTSVSRAIIAGTWVAFFQRVPAMIVRPGTVQGMRNNGWSDEAIEHIDAVQQQVGLTL